MKQQSALLRMQRFLRMIVSESDQFRRMTPSLTGTFAQADRTPTYQTQGIEEPLH
jgi:hypothetical protein